MRPIRVSKGKAITVVLGLLALSPIVYGFITESFTQPDSDRVTGLGMYATVVGFLIVTFILGLIVLVGIRLIEYIKDNW